LESPHASYQVSVHLAKRLQRRRFLKIGQSETRIAYGGHGFMLLAICEFKTISDLFFNF
jgi:hypothetical protein